jgi:DNA-binding NtrC family response regulator
MMSMALNGLRPEEPAGVVVATPNDSLRKQIVETLAGWCWPVQEARGGADALNKLEDSECDLLLLDRCLPDLDAMELAALIKGRFPGIDLMMLDSETGRATASEPLQRVSARFLLRKLEGKVWEDSGEDAPLTPHVVSGTAQNKEKSSPIALPEMRGDSEAARQIYRMARLVAARDTAVLLLGESGTGKDLVAQGIHKLSPRAMKPFVVINCAAIPEALLESELFGYTRGAFTGAAQSRIGRIHAAQGGTLFLDEIGDLPLNLQAKLLRFLESGEVQRLGSSDVFRVDVRVIAATNADLQKKVVAGDFRRDLFYRLSVFPIMLLPLRNRRDDIVPLANHFLEMLETKPMQLSTEAEAVLQAYDWPGNVRELKHVIERAIILAEDDTRISAKHILIMTPESSFA